MVIYKSSRFPSSYGDTVDDYVTSLHTHKQCHTAIRKLVFPSLAWCKAVGLGNLLSHGKPAHINTT